jgi:penicillin-binding protein A
MNRPIRRVAVAVGVLLLALLINLNFVQVVRADSYRNNQANRRTVLDEYANPRGQIVVGGNPIAESVVTADELKYLRRYPVGAQYAPLTGFYSLVYGKDGLEFTEDGVLSGNDPRLFASRLADILTGRNPKGGSVTLTVNAAAQTAAFKGLGNRRGAVVALDPSTGAILAAATSPSYDPNLLSSHNVGAVQAAGSKLFNDKSQPTLDRALLQSYPAGSIFKVVTAAAALKAGRLPTDRIAAPDLLRLPDGGTMQNFNGERCGDGRTTTLDAALTVSCNTAFAQLCLDLGQQSVQDEATLFGMDNLPRRVPLAVARSTMGEITDRSALAQACIGQRNMQVTPLQAAMFSAAVANGGQLMKPYLVAQERAPNLSVLTNTRPSQLSTVLPEGQDKLLQQMMTNVVTKGTGTQAQIPNVQVGGKTGTADNEDANGNRLAPHAWFTGFALDANHPIAVAVILENAGVTGSESAGGVAAAPLARDVMKAYLDNMRGQ